MQLEGWCRSGVGPLLMGVLLCTLGDGSEGLFGLAWSGVSPELLAPVTQ